MVNLPVPTAGKTGTTNDARDGGSSGFTSSIAAGCYIGYDQPQPLGSAPRAAPCAGRCSTGSCKKPSRNMAAAPFAVPDGGAFSRSTGIRARRLPDGAQGANVVYEVVQRGRGALLRPAVDHRRRLGHGLGPAALRRGARWRAGRGRRPDRDHLDRRGGGGCQRIGLSAAQFRRASTSAGRRAPPPAPPRPPPPRPQKAERRNPTCAHVGPPQVGARPCDGARG